MPLTASVPFLMSYKTVCPKCLNRYNHKLSRVTVTMQRAVRGLVSTSIRNKHQLQQRIPSVQYSAYACTQS